MTRCRQRPKGLLLLFSVFFFHSYPVNADPPQQTTDSLLQIQGIQDQHVRPPRSASPVQPAVMEQIPGGMFMLISYVLIWFLLFAYVLRLGRLYKRMRADIVRLEQSIKRKREP